MANETTPAASATTVSATVPPTVASGSRVVVIVSKGPAPTPPSAFVDVPEIVGIPQGDALLRLQEAGFSAQVFNDYSDEVEHGSVIGQLPDFDQSIPSGSEVVMLVSSGPSASPVTPTVLPNVVGATEADAIARLQTAGLSPQIVHDYSPNIPEGAVVGQLPSAHSIAEIPPRKTPLTWLWILLALAAVAAIAGGAYYFLNRTAVVPNVVGLPQAQAEQTIAKAGFKVGSIGTTQTLSASEVGNVTTQTPPPNAEERMGSAINIIVSGGQLLIEIPDVTAKTQADAESILKSAGLQPSVSSAFSATVPAGSVISQLPSAGQRVPTGTTVGITVSQGVQNVIVPGVIGQTQSTAQNALKNVGLTYQSVTNFNASVPKGQVSSQYPSAGTSIAPGTIVGIVISNGSATSTATVTVPSVVGLAQATAQSNLKKVNLANVVVQWSGSGVPAGQVVGQTPDAGAVVPRNSTIIIFVSNGK